MPRTKHSKLYNLEPEGPDEPTSKRRRKTVRREPEPRPPDIGRIIENGLAMLMPFIVERIVASATAPERHAPVPAPRVPGYFDGYQHAIDEARYVIRTECASCGCTLCRKMMSDDEPLDPRLGGRPRGGQ